MPKTIIVRQTYHCTGCTRFMYYQDGTLAKRLGFESGNLVGMCSTEGCRGDIYLETDPAKCGTLTIIGDEDIEAEISAIQKERTDKGKAEYDAPTIAQYRTQRRAEKNAAIAAARVKEKK